jgi:hypothetical protein
MDMSDEAQAKLILALGDAVDALLEQAERQQNVVQGVLSVGGEALKAVSLAGNEHRALARELPKQIKESITGALDGAAVKAAEILSSQFADADKQASLAADRYEKAARVLGWKWIGVAIGAWAATVVIAILAISYTSAEARILREDSGMLATVMRYLQQNPQGAQIALCNPRAGAQTVCVYVPIAKNKWEWRVLAQRPEPHSQQ